LRIKQGAFIIITIIIYLPFVIVDAQKIPIYIDHLEKCII